MLPDSNKMMMMMMKRSENDVRDEVRVRQITFPRATPHSETGTTKNRRGHDDRQHLPVMCLSL